MFLSAYSKFLYLFFGDSNQELEDHTWNSNELINGLFFQLGSSLRWVIKNVYHGSLGKRLFLSELQFLK